VIQSRRRLGRSDLGITAVGLGTWAIGGQGTEGYGPQNDDDSVAAIHRAVQAGVNWIDTAAQYGLGHSEETVGRALAEMAPGDRPLVFTKCGLVPDPQRPFDRPKRILTPQSMRRELEASLRRLGVERIDLYQVHRPDETGTPMADSWGEMGRFIEEGKVRAAGVSNFELDELDAYEAIRHIDSLQPPFSLVHRSAAQQIAWCARHDVGVIAYGPMGAGLLTDEFSAERVGALPSDDWRRTDAEFQGERLQRNLELRDALRPIARRHQTPLSAVAIAWVLAWPGVTGAIAGARRAAQVDDWVRAAEIQLSTEDLREVSASIERTGAGAGPVEAVGIGNPDSITQRRRGTRGSARRGDPVGERRAD
jgi:aryl-alcohol dehydrogenase-like predicted oxidoreductase